MLDITKGQYAHAVHGIVDEFMAKVAGNGEAVEYEGLNVLKDVPALQGRKQIPKGPGIEATENN